MDGDVVANDEAIVLEVTHRLGLVSLRAKDVREVVVKRR